MSFVVLEVEYGINKTEAMVGETIEFWARVRNKTIERLRVGAWGFAVKRGEEKPFYKYWWEQLLSPEGETTFRWFFKMPFKNVDAFIVVYYYDRKLGDWVKHSDKWFEIKNVTMERLKRWGWVIPLAVIGGGTAYAVVKRR